MVTTKIVIHIGVVWVVDIRQGWYWALKAFPQAVKEIEKDVFVPDVTHTAIAKYIGERCG